MSIVDIKLSEHVFIAGMTGSGKTYLAQVYLMNDTEQQYVLDTKGTFEYIGIEPDEFELVTTFEELYTTTKSKVIYRPIWEELDEYYYNEFFKFCMQRRNCRVIVDEGMQVSKSANSIVEWYKGILTRGRELNVSVWTLTQRPTNIPLIVLSESTHYFIFRLNAISDRKRLVDYTGFDEFSENPPQKYAFNYFNTQKDKAPVFARLSD